MRAASPVETLEHALGLACLDARAVVADTQLGMSVARSRTHLDTCTTWSVSQGVLYERSADAQDAILVAEGRGLIALADEELVIGRQRSGTELVDQCSRDAGKQHGLSFDHELACVDP